MSKLKVSCLVIFLFACVLPWLNAAEDQVAGEEGRVFAIESHDRGALLHLDDDVILFEGVPWSGRTEIGGSVDPITDKMLDMIWWDNKKSGTTNSGSLSARASDGRGIQMAWSNKDTTITIGDLSFDLLADNTRIKFRNRIAPLDGRRSLVFRRDGYVMPLGVDADQLAPANQDANGSLELDGRGAVVADLALPPDGLGAFTLECRARGVPPSEVQRMLLCQGNWDFGIAWPGVKRALPAGFAYIAENQCHAHAGATEAWDWNETTHLALSFDGHHLRFFVNGKLQEETEAAGRIPFGDRVFRIGAAPDDQGNTVSFFQGSIDEVRLSDTCRYTQDFEPAPVHGRDGHTMLLLHFDSQKHGFYADDSGCGNHGWHVATLSRELRPVDLAEMRSHVTVFPGWEKYAVPQRSVGTGCIATGYEMLLRAASTEGVDFKTFQEEFDLGLSKNCFQTVAAAVHEKYPHVEFSAQVFDSGKEKLRFVESRLATGHPTLISLAMAPQGGWHIMPVVDHDEDELYLLYIVAADGTKDLRAISKAEFVRRHDEWPGGKDVAFLKTE